jgi:MFS transporter, OPA family, solute carrier family 37 (glycerol-3-phosphate transporter), member 3
MGSFIMGYLSDKLYSKRSPVSFVAVLIASALGFTLTYQLKEISQIILSLVLFFFGFIVSGLNNIISASCAADIGKNQVLQASQRSQSTVAGIIDGSGSLGAAIGQIIIGVVVSHAGWDKFMLIISIDITLTVIPLIKIVVEELIEVYHIIKEQRRKSTR